jgi:ribosomal-protein-alanine N-acetyltransferase
MSLVRLDPAAPLVTARLTLLPFTRDLVVLALRNRAALSRVLGLAVAHDWPGPALEEILPFLDGTMAARPERAHWMRLIVQRDDRMLIGSVGFMDVPDAEQKVELGYHLVPLYRGHGYATEAARGMLALAFAHGVRLVQAECDRENAASIRVLQRLGMVCTGRDGSVLQWTLQALEEETQ